MTDPDGVSGAGTYAQWGAEGYGDRKLEYCQKFWQYTIAIEPMEPEEITFYTRGNLVAHVSTKPVWECVQDVDGMQEPEFDDRESSTVEEESVDQDDGLETISDAGGMVPGFTFAISSTAVLLGALVPGLRGRLE